MRIAKHSKQSTTTRSQGKTQLYLKLPDNGGERSVFPALFVQQGDVVVKLADVGGVHLQVRTLLDKDVRQPLVVAPVKYIFSPQTD